MPEKTQSNGFKVGARVKHPKFGIGTVLQTEGIGGEERAQVLFPEGLKWLVLAYAELEAIEKAPPCPNKSPFRLRLVVDNSRIQAENFIQNVDKIEKQTVNVIEKQVNHYRGNSKPKPAPIPRLLPEQGGLTDGHRTTLKKLIDKYVMLLRIIKPTTGKSGLYAIANRAACEQAISSGSDGCGSITRMQDKDFERVATVLKGRIAGLCKNRLVVQKRTARLDEAHKRFKELGVSEETRRHYQLAKYGHESMADFDVAELADYLDYLRQPAPTFTRTNIINALKTTRPNSPQPNATPNKSGN